MADATRFDPFDFLPARTLDGLVWEDDTETALWDGSAFVADSAPARTGGAVPLPEGPAGTYGPASLPAGLAPGRYWLRRYERAGADPDPADYPRDAGEWAAVPPADPADDLDDAALAAARRRTPWPEAVFFRSVRTAGDETAAVYADGVYRVSEAEAVRRSNGVYTRGMVVATLPMPLATGEPKPRDVLTWGGREYAVTDVAGTSWFPTGAFWKLTCVSPKLAGDLDQTLALKRPAVAPGAGGLRGVSALTTVWAGDGRLQPDQMSVRDAAGKLAADTRYSAVLGTTGPTPRASAGDVIEDADGVRYEVESQQDIDQLGLLTAVTCTRLT